MCFCKIGPLSDKWRMNPFYISQKVTGCLVHIFVPGGKKKYFYDIWSFPINGACIVFYDTKSCRPILIKL